jgi:hypothetical protein
VERLRPGPRGRRRQASRRAPRPSHMGGGIALALVASAVGAWSPPAFDPIGRSQLSNRPRGASRVRSALGVPRRR